MLVRLDSFDHYSGLDQILQKYTQVYDGSNNVDPVIVPGAGNNGTSCIRFSAASAGQACKPLALVVPIHTKYTTGFRFTTSGVGGWASRANGQTFYPWVGLTSLSPRGDTWIHAFRSDNYSHVTAFPLMNGCIQFWKGHRPSSDPTYAVKLGVSDFALQWGRTYYLEFQIDCNTVGGRYIFKVNGDVWFDYTGSTVYEGTYGRGILGPVPANVNEIVFGHVTNGVGAIGITGQPVWDIDDLYISNGDASNPRSPCVGFFGDHRIDWRAVVANGAHADWIPSESGDNFEMVDEAVHTDDTDYNESNTPGDRDSFEVEDAILAGYPVDAMQPVYAAKRTQGGPSSMRSFVRHGGQDYDGTARGNTTNYSFGGMDVWERITASGESPVVITDSVFNAVEVGYEKVL